MLILLMPLQAGSLVNIHAGMEGAPSGSTDHGFASVPLSACWIHEPGKITFDLVRMGEFPVLWLLISLGLMICMRRRRVN